MTLMTLRAAIVRELVMIRDGRLGLTEEFSRDDVCAHLFSMCARIFEFLISVFLLPSYCKMY